MLKNIAIDYYDKGYNCSQCILRACCDKYNIILCDNCLEMFQGISNGFGIGSMCSVLITGIMVLSSIDADNIKLNRMKLIDEFYTKNGGINCGKIRKEDCKHIIENTCDILEMIIDDI